jgi:hypothetical protein
LQTATAQGKDRARSELAIRGSDVLTLYYAPHTCSLASHIALKDVGAKYELKRIDFGKAEQQSPAYYPLSEVGESGLHYRR